MFVLTRVQLKATSRIQSNKNANLNAEYLVAKMDFLHENYHRIGEKKNQTQLWSHDGPKQQSKSRIKKSQTS